MLVFALLFALAQSALASDGVLEINHTCAVGTGCFSGDTPGYPVTIDRSAQGVGGVSVGAALIEFRVDRARNVRRLLVAPVGTQKGLSRAQLGGSVV